MPTTTANDYKIRQTQVTRLPLGTYDFIIHYAEMLNEQTAEFRHSHSYMELFYVSHGKLTIRFDDNDEVTVTHGDLLFVPPDIPHHVLNIPGEKRSYFVIIFELRQVKSPGSRHTTDSKEVYDLDMVLKKLPQDTYTFCSPGWDGDDYLNEIYKEMSHKEFGWSAYVNMVYYGFFLNAVRHIISVDEKQSEPDDSLNLAIEATKYIHAHYSEDISLETLAAYLYISPRHANRMFRKMFNTTFGKTLKALRLTYAKTLLATTDLSVDVVAERVGLNSAQTLRKLFKQSEGITISQYKHKDDPE